MHRMIKCCPEKVRGTMSVELTLLMPFVIGVFLFVFFTLYYLHDVAAIQKGCAGALIRGSLIRDRREAQMQMENAMEEIRLLGKWEMQKSCLVQNNLVTISVDGKMSANEGLFKKLITGAYVYSTHQSCGRIDETVYILHNGGD